MYNELLKKYNKIAVDQAQDFKREIERVWPVDLDDTNGHSKDKWVVENNVVKNTSSYSAILWMGRYYSSNAGKWMGSTQLPQGGDPVLTEFIRKQNGRN